MMIVVGMLGVSLIGIGAVVLAGITVFGGWRAFNDELLRRNFRSRPPGVMGWTLTLLGVLLPVAAVALFLLALAGRLIGLFIPHIPHFYLYL